MNNEQLKIKKILLIAFLVSLFSFNVYADFDRDSTTVPELNAKTNLDSTDMFLIAQAVDSANYKVLWDRIADSVEDSIRGVIVNAWIASGAAIALNKLASGTAAYFIVNNGSGVPTYVAMSGDATLANTGAVTLAAGSVGTSEITNGVIVDEDINAAAGITLSKLATGTEAYIIVNNSGGVPTSVAMTGDATISNAGVVSIGTGVIVNADISASAGIALSKLATSTAGNVIVYNSGGVPTSTTMSGDATITDAGVVDLADALTDNFTFSGNLALNGSVSSAIDSIDISSGLSPYTLSATGLSQTVILYTSNTTSTVADFSNGTDGQKLTIISAISNQDQITIDHGTEILSPTGADVVLGAAGDNVTMVYYSVYDRWIITSIQN